MFINRFLRQHTVLQRCLVSLTKIKQLRELTGSPLSECKSALEKTKEDLEKAKEILVAKGFLGLKNKSKKQIQHFLARKRKDGFLSLKETEKSIQLINLGCQTDFVARTVEFRDSLKVLLATLEAFPKPNVENSDLAAFLAALPSGPLLPKFEKKNIDEILKLLQAHTSEDCGIESLLKREKKPGIIVGTYIHNEIEPQIGTKAAIVFVESNCTNVDKIKGLANSLALQVTATNPLYTDKNCIPAEIMKAKEKDQEFFMESVLMEQKFFESEEENAKTVREIIEEKQKELNGIIKIKEYFNFNSQQ